MKCPSCGCENREGAKFCGECAAILADALVCAKCGTANPKGRKFLDSCGNRIGDVANRAQPPDPRSYTPKHLAEKILTSRSALEGERKQVTVLFADVKGSMDLAEQVDPEKWHGILDRFFQILSEGVHRFEGTINQYTGDGIMALFGAPIAHEDHAQRACYAALHLRDELRSYAEELKRTRGLSFLVRMGINSGEVVVGRIGDDLRMDYTAQGQTVGLAARMEQLAAPGSAYLTEHTAKLVSGFFQLREILGRSKSKVCVIRFGSTSSRVWAEWGRASRCPVRAASRSSSDVRVRWALSRQHSSGQSRGTRRSWVSSPSREPARADSALNSPSVVAREKRYGLPVGDTVRFVDRNLPAALTAP